MALLQRALAPTLPLIALTCTSCRGWQSALDPQGPQATQLESLLWIFIAVCTLVWITVMVVLALALRRHSSGSNKVTHKVDTDTEHRMARVVGAAAGATTIIVLGLTFTSFFTTHKLSAHASEPLTLRVRGHQWWWEITYLNTRADQIFTTANEIHIPIGRPVRLELAAADVIHSFWVPNLAGKQDLIPGRDNTLTLTATQPGLYRGQCAEFCGLQHAHMALLVIAEPAAAFEHWRQTQLEPAEAPGDAERLTGQKVFISKPCAACHTIEGTSASATVGPDLTHVAGRSYIAAGLLPTTRGSLAAWIADPQTLKPGNNMPAVPLTAAELDALSAYLAALK
jgi:cytochrome c oxidase subunit II